MKNQFFSNIGKVALGSRLRLLTSRIDEDSPAIYQLYGTEFSPKWFPVFVVLSQDGPKSIGEIAEAIGHSQPSVSKIINEMSASGLVKQNALALDRRKSLVNLTKKGAGFSQQIRIQAEDVDAAIQALMDEATHNLWEAISEWESLLEKKSILRRVEELKKQREGKKVRIVDYQPRYRPVFQALNEEWISTYFQMEEADHKVLDNPKKYILNKGGKIFVALYNGEPLGVCALIKMNDSVYDYEMAKMAVSSRAKGKNIGYLLGQAVVDAAIKAGASKLYLESNTSLKPAINLYHKLGFKKVTGRISPYARTNIQMELDLKEAARA